MQPAAPWWNMIGKNKNAPKTPKKAIVCFWFIKVLEHRNEKAFTKKNLDIDYTYYFFKIII
jgi:hypothetical protein